MAVTAKDVEQLHDGCTHCPSVGEPIAHGLPTAASPLYCFRLKQIGKLLRLASCFKSDLSATSSWQPLGLPAAGRMSIRWIIPRSSWSRVWQCATKQPTVIGLKYVRNVIDPGVASLMFAGGPPHVEAGSPGHTAAGTSKVSCHSGSGRVIPFIFVISTWF